MMNNALFRHFNNMQNQNINPALYKVQLENKIKELRSSGIDGDRKISEGIANGEISQQQADFAYGLAKNIAKNLFGYSR